MNREPARGEQSRQTRVCGWIVVSGVPETVCGKQASAHVAFSDWNVFVCDQHEPLVLSRFEPRARHFLGADCGMPGSVFDLNANVCRYFGDELPASERAEREISA